MNQLHSFLGGPRANPGADVVVYFAGAGAKGIFWNIQRALLCSSTQRCVNHFSLGSIKTPSNRARPDISPNYRLLPDTSLGLCKRDQIHQREAVDLFGYQKIKTQHPCSIRCAVCTHIRELVNCCVVSSRGGCMSQRNICHTCVRYLGATKKIANEAAQIERLLRSLPPTSMQIRNLSPNRAESIESCGDSAKGENDPVSAKRMATESSWNHTQGTYFDGGNQDRHDNSELSLTEPRIGGELSELSNGSIDERESIYNLARIRNPNSVSDALKGLGEKVAKREIRFTDETIDMNRDLLLKNSRFWSLPESVQVYGLIVYYNKQRKYGLIRPSGGGTLVFMHNSAIEDLGVGSTTEPKIRWKGGVTIGVPTPRPMPGFCRPRMKTTLNDEIDYTKPAVSEDSAVNTEPKPRKRTKSPIKSRTKHLNFLPEVRQKVKFQIFIDPKTAQTTARHVFRV